VNVKEMIPVPDDQSSVLIQRWIIVTDEQGREHLEARWVVETPAGHGVPLAAA
jgi:hypothetical protein